MTKRMLMISASEFAVYLGMTTRQLWRLVDEGKLPAPDAGRRWDADRAGRWLDRHGRPVPPLKKVA